MRKLKKKEKGNRGRGRTGGQRVPSKQGRHVGKKNWEGETRKRAWGEKRGPKKKNMKKGMNNPKTKKVKRKGKDPLKLQGGGKSMGSLPNTRRK